MFRYTCVCRSIWFQNAGIKCYDIKIVQQLKSTDIAKIRQFHQTILDKIKESLTS